MNLVSLNQTYLIIISMVHLSDVDYYEQTLIKLDPVQQMFVKFSGLLNKIFNILYRDVTNYYLVFKKREKCS